MNIVLIGARGSGKSAVAQALAELTGRTAVSTDTELEREVGCSISEYVAEHGWDVFRGRENEVVTNVCVRDNLIIDTGGGVVLRPSNVDALRANGYVIWLRATVTTMAARIGDATNRPSLTGAKSFVDEIAEVAAARAPLYAAAAHYVVDTDDRSPISIATEIADLTRT